MYILGEFPKPESIETIEVLKKTIAANKSLAELKGISKTIPRPEILINTLAIQEAKDSSEIENIITTQDDVFTEGTNQLNQGSIASKEVHRYVEALQIGYKLIQEDSLLTVNHIIKILQVIKKTNQGLRVQAGTALVNENTGNVIYQPPQNPAEICKLMELCEKLINDGKFLEVDPLVKMAIIHHFFESIHPFTDGNGRTGRIINVLYLVLKEYLDLPILYLSRYIVRTKSRYYELLQMVRDENNWTDWILYILQGIDETAKETIDIVKSIGNAMQDYKQRMRKIDTYSQELLNNLFTHPYTKIEYVINSIGVSRPTATKYLEKLVENNLLEKRKIWRQNYYINLSLMSIFED